MRPKFLKLAGFGEYAYALDSDGRVWLRFDAFGQKWTRLDQPGDDAPAYAVLDIYVHVTDGEGALRVVNNLGQLFTLRMFGNEPIWDTWPPQDREPFKDRSDE